MLTHQKYKIPLLNSNRPSAGFIRMNLASEQIGARIRNCRYRLIGLPCRRMKNVGVIESNSIKLSFVFVNCRRTK